MFLPPSPTPGLCGGTTTSCCVDPSHLCGADNQPYSCTDKTLHVNLAVLLGAVKHGFLNLGYCLEQTSNRVFLSVGDKCCTFVLSSFLNLFTFFR